MTDEILDDETAAKIKEASPELEPEDGHDDPGIPEDVAEVD